MADIEEQQDEEDPETLDDEEEAGDPAGDEYLEEEEPEGEPVDDDSAVLSPEHRAKLDAIKKRAYDLGYGKMYEDAAREEMPGLTSVMAKKQAVKDMKAAARKELLRAYPSMRLPSDEPQDAA